MGDPHGTLYVLDIAASAVGDETVDVRPLCHVVDAGDAEHDVGKYGQSVCFYALDRAR